MSPQFYIGMISGTSRDGADAALVHFKENRVHIEEAICIPYPAGLAHSLDLLIASGRRPMQAAMEDLDRQLADHFSDTVRLLLEKATIDKQDIRAIGSHGQTVWHEPDSARPESIQLGSPHRIAQSTGILTIGDFRRADIQAGGQGAPLAPLLHRALFRPDPAQGTATRVVLNLGGIANISVIDHHGRVTGFDTGPANCLMDGWVGVHRGQAFDRDGLWAAGGRCISPLLESLLSDPYFHRPSPKSTGIEYFNLAWLEKFITGVDLDARDVQATLAELTAISVSEAIRQHDPADVLVCGGGVHNLHLLQRLQELLPGIPLKSTADFGLDPDWVEAVLFAWLARERLAERPLDTREITGAKMPVLLGTITLPH